MNDTRPWVRAAAQAAELAAELEAARERAARMRLSGEATGSRLASIELGGGHVLARSSPSSARRQPWLNRVVRVIYMYVIRSQTLVCVGGERRLLNRPVEVAAAHSL